MLSGLDTIHVLRQLSHLRVIRRSGQSLAVCSAATVDAHWADGDGDIVLALFGLGEFGETHLLSQMALFCFH